MTELFLARAVVEPLVRVALAEDLGLAGDITSNAIISPDHRSSLAFISRQNGVVAGLDAAELAFQLLDPRITMDRRLADGSDVRSGDIIAIVEGPSRSLLTAERVALNFLGHLSGISTVTAEVVAAIAGTGAKVACTRKTTPGLRALEKYAVRAGGGINHRFGLYDAFLIKDNHIAIAGGLAPAIRRAKRHAGHMVKIEVEVDTLEQLQEAMSEGVDVVLLDNMTPEQLEEAVSLVNGRALTEASGGITLGSAPTIAATGVDLLSIGWLTHSAPVLDIGLDVISSE